MRDTGNYFDDITYKYASKNPKTDKILLPSSYYTSLYPQLRLIKVNLIDRGMEITMFIIDII